MMMRFNLYVSSRKSVARIVLWMKPGPRTHFLRFAFQMEMLRWNLINNIHWFALGRFSWCQCGRKTDISLLGCEKVEKHLITKTFIYTFFPNTCQKNILKNLTLFVRIAIKLKNIGISKEPSKIFIVIYLKLPHKHTPKRKQKPLSWIDQMKFPEFWGKINVNQIWDEIKCKLFMFRPAYLP